MEQKETEYLIKIRKDIIEMIPGLNTFRNDNGTYKRNGITRRYGLGTGSSDIVGILSPEGAFVSIEVKTLSEYDRVIRMIAGELKFGEHEENQYKWLCMIQRLGGIACFAWNITHVMASITQWRKK
jgi:hypothetical protein